MQKEEKCKNNCFIRHITLLLPVFVDEVGLRARPTDTRTPRHRARGADRRRMRPADVGGRCAGGREPVTSTVVG